MPIERSHISLSWGTKMTTKRLHVVWITSFFIAGLASYDGFDIAKGTSIEIGFSPEGSAQSLILKVIHAARYEIRIACYSFTSQPIVDALIEAKLRGVDIKIVIDSHADNLIQTRRAIRRIRQSGIRVRYNDVYKIQHDKIIIVDQSIVETGSYNYTESAAMENSENVIVIWRSPSTAKQYLEHWLIRWNQARRNQD